VRDALSFSSWWLRKSSGDAALAATYLGGVCGSYTRAAAAGVAGSDERHKHDQAIGRLMLLVGAEDLVSG